jgi:hypothetical protein
MFKHTQHNVKQMAIVVACAAIMAVILLPAGASAQRVLELNEMVILNEDGMDLQGKFDLYGGSICSRKGNIVLGESGTVRLYLGQSNSCTDFTHDTVVTATASAVLDLKYFSRFGRDQAAYTDNLVPGGRLPGCVYPTSEITCPDDPPFPVFIASDLKADDVYCTAAGTAIGPGTYRDLIVEEVDGKCNFQGPGEYVFRSIQTINTGYELNFLNGECGNAFNINVETFVTLGEYGSVNRSGADSVFIHVAGQDGPYPGDYEFGSGNDNPNSSYTAQPSVFYYMGDGHFNVCYVFTPNGTTALKGLSKSIWNTQWINKYIFQTTSQIIKAKVGDNYEECCEAQECACVLDFWEKVVDTGDNLLITGKNFNTVSVKKVLFFDVDEPIDKLSDPGDSAVCKQATVNILDSENMEVVVPAGCPSGDYYVGLENGAFCYAKNKKLTIK